MALLAIEVQMGSRIHNNPNALRLFFYSLKIEAKL